MTVREPWHWLVYALALVVGVLALVGVWLRVQAYPEPLDPPRTLHVPADAPCSLDRYGLACQRWSTRARACVVTPVAGEVVAVAYPGPEAGAHGVGRGAARGELGVRADHCGRYDATVEHEVGHALYGLPHHHGVGVMAEDPADVRMP